MQKAQWFLYAAVATPSLLVAACGGDDESGAPIHAGGSAGASIDASVGDAAGRAGAGGAAGSGGSAGAVKDGRSAEAAMDGSTGVAGAAGTGGAAGAAGTGGARPDAAGDVSRPDGSVACMSGPAAGMTCNDYCSAWFSTCQPIAMWSATYATPAACLAACTSWNDAKLCCRAEHVHNAVVASKPNQAEKHCGHAAGVDGPDPCNG
jgi:hypothetical protein